MRLAKIKIRILWSDKQMEIDNHRNIESGEIVFFVRKSLTEHFEDAMIKVWKTFKMFIEENGEKKTQQLTNKNEKSFQETLKDKLKLKIILYLCKCACLCYFLQHLKHFWHNHSKVKQLLDGCNERKLRELETIEVFVRVI